MTTPRIPFWQALTLLALLTASALAEAPCPDPKFSVKAEDDALAARACTVASDFVASLEPCGLTLLRPVVIEITDVIDPDNPHCAARFDCDNGTLSVLTPERLARIGKIDVPFAKIPALDFFDSLVVHELTHALLHETAPGMVSRVAHEYLAHAMQLRALPAQSRNAFLQEAPVEHPPTASINMMVLYFVPSHFAASSWHFYQSHPDNCSAVQQVLDRKTPFIEF